MGIFNGFTFRLVDGRLQLRHTWSESVGKAMCRDNTYGRIYDGFGRSIRKTVLAIVTPVWTTDDNYGVETMKDDYTLETREYGNQYAVLTDGTAIRLNDTQGAYFTEFEVSEAKANGDDSLSGPGFYYAYGSPGCLPDSDWFGPFDTADAAQDAAVREQINHSF